MSQVMEIRFNVEKEARKALVRAIVEIVGVESVYKGAPSFAFVVYNYTIDRYGTLSFDERVDLEDARRLLAELGARGYVGEGSIEAPAAEPVEVEGQPPADITHQPTDMEHQAVDAVESAQDEGFIVPAPAPAPDSRTYRAELGDPENPDRMEVFGAEDDEDALRKAFGFAVDGVVLLELHELDEGYDAIRAVDIPRGNLETAEESETAAQPVANPGDATDSDDTGVSAEVAPSEVSALGNLRSVVNEPGGKLTIEVPFVGFTSTALENLDRLVSGKAWLIMKAIGADGSEGLPIIRTDSTLQFPWFPVGSPNVDVDVDAYARLAHALCELAKKQKRVTLKEKPIAEDASEKFAFRCFLLRLGFIGKEYASARKVLLSRLSGNGSFKSGDHKARAAPAPHTLVTTYNGNTTANGGEDDAGGAVAYDEVYAAVSGNDGDSDSVDADAVVVVPERCADCPHHCYYSDGEMRSDGGKVVDTSNREPQRYTHYCVETPSGFRRLKHAAEWSGNEAPPKWCPLRSAATADNIEEGGAVDE